jgi:hypothetical protein
VRSFIQIVGAVSEISPEKEEERKKKKIHFASGPRFFDPKAPSLKEMGI